MVIRQEAIGINVKMTVLDCPTCGMMFAITAELEKRRREDGRSFYCPLGHSGHFTESDVERVKREASEQIARMEKRLAFNENMYQAEFDRRKATEASLRATKGVVTRMKKRAANGVCPCCTRHFTNLERHMETKHPEYAKGEEDASPKSPPVFAPVDRPVAPADKSNPSGLCLCGCGQRTSLAQADNPKLGYVKGQPMRYIKGHHLRKPRP